MILSLSRFQMTVSLSLSKNWTQYTAHIKLPGNLVKGPRNGGRLRTRWSMDDVSSAALGAEALEILRTVLKLLLMLEITIHVSRKHTVYHPENGRYRSHGEIAVSRRKRQRNLSTMRLCGTLCMRELPSVRIRLLLLESNPTRTVTARDPEARAQDYTQGVFILPRLLANKH